MLGTQEMKYIHTKSSFKNVDQINMQEIVKEERTTSHKPANNRNKTLNIRNPVETNPLMSLKKLS